MRVLVVGAGMAGLACARALAAAGHAARLLDKGRRPGGRMSTRRVALADGERTFDHGAQYFTARAPAFVAEVERWAADGLVARWPAAGADAWVGVPAMDAPPAALADAGAVRCSAHVMALARRDDGWQATLRDGDREGGFDAAVLALPAEQAAAFLGSHDLGLAARATRTRSRPCWTLMAAFAAPLALGGDVRRGDGALAWAARDSAKPGRAAGEAWVVQADGAWSTAHLEDDADTVAQLLLDRLRQAAGGTLPPVVHLAAHRWRYALSDGADAGPQWNPALRLGACGDWLPGSGVEAAWLSGTALAARMLRDLA
ncbi:MAG: NAD(P)-binding protein [Sphingomonadales bacterium]|nr:NAD(P)-binding protein [Sphingomonadales bacterium]